MESYGSPRAYRSTPRLDAGVPKQLSASSGLTEQAFVKLRRSEPDHLPACPDDAPTIQEATAGMWTPKMQKESEFQQRKLLLAAIETIQQGSASAEDAAALADVVAEFNVAEQKRKRRRVLDEARRARAFKKREAAPSNR